jgi:hypothetical protein
MLGINSSTCVQVAPVEIPRAGPGRGAREGTPTAVGIGGINSSASVQVAPVVILAAHLGVGRADVSGHRDNSNCQRGQESEDSKAHDCLSMCRGAASSHDPLPEISSMKIEEIQGRIYPGYGMCVYCGSDGRIYGLRDEHVVPFSCNRGSFPGVGQLGASRTRLSSLGFAVLAYRGGRR